MKITSLKIKNIGLIADEEIKLDKPLILFYGEIRQGKTTILNAVRWVCGGSYPDDIIRHGEKDASIELGFDGGCIRREWYRGKKGETKDRAVTFVRNGKPVSNPVAEIKRLLNPFLLNQDYLRQMTETERKAYFTEQFAVDTTELDKEAFNASQSAQALRSKLTGYGELDLKPVEAVDATALKTELAEIKRAAAERRSMLEGELSKANKYHREAVEAANAENGAIRRHNEDVRAHERRRQELENGILEFEKRIIELRDKQTAESEWLKLNPEKSEKGTPLEPDLSEIKQKILDAASPDTTELETKIQNAAAQNVRAEQYAKNKKRAEEKGQDEKTLSALEKRQREIKAEKVAKLATISETCGIKELAFDEIGQFTYQGTQAGMLSTSQIMRLSSELSALYPEGLGVELLDRGESLGKSIFEFVDRAKADDLTILATIVGEAPAKAPAEIGVFVVEAGKVKEAA